MGGGKLFTNKTPYKATVTLVIRRSADPRNTAGTQEFTLDPNQASWQTYGDPVNIYLNGIKLVSMFNGQIVGQQHIVIVRGSQLDDQLNTKNAVDFLFANGSFTISTHEVHMAR